MAAALTQLTINNTAAQVLMGIEISLQPLYYNCVNINSLHISDISQCKMLRKFTTYA